MAVHQVGEVVHKVLGATVELKEEGEGEEAKGTFIAKIATTGVKDLDGDVIVKGAFGNQKVKVAAYGHNWMVPPVGKGQVYEKGTDALASGEFFLKTANGLETFRVVKELMEEGEWSFGFRITDGERGKLADEEVYFIKAMDLYEVSPVIKGASIGTGTVEAKGKSQTAELPVFDYEKFAQALKEAFGPAPSQAASAQAASAQAASAQAASAQTGPAADGKPEAKDTPALVLSEESIAALAKAVAEAVGSGTAGAPKTAVDAANSGDGGAGADSQTAPAQAAPAKDDTAHANRILMQMQAASR